MASSPLVLSQLGQEVPAVATLFAHAVLRTGHLLPRVLGADAYVAASPVVNAVLQSMQMEGFA